MKPFKYESGTPFFSKRDCEIYGYPEHHGYWDYIVVDDIEPLYVHDYTSEFERKLRPVHRYSRVERFSSILGQLLGLRGDVDPETLALCSECKSWEEIRNTLRRAGKSRLYNRIPTIMSILKLEPPIKIDITNEMYYDIIDDFIKCQNNYEKANVFIERKYFPSLRFIACKLLEKRGAVFDEKIKFIRTRHKLKCLNSIWVWIS